MVLTTRLPNTCYTSQWNTQYHYLGRQLELDRCAFCQYLFENYNKVNAPAANIKHYLGEAHFFKAWLYFEKVKQFGDVPWYTNSLQLDSKELYNERAPRTAVVDSILWHLDKATENLSFLKDAVGGNNRLSKEAALIFKSRVALYEGSWQKYHAGTAFGTTGADPKKYFRAAADAAAELMTPGKYKVGIVGTSAIDYTTLFASTNLSSNNEIILWAKFDKTLNTFRITFSNT
ncbi:MAG: RagB/SusD family nutrient uptake outer membrane protein [Spirosomataceae bacterium]